MEVLFTRDHVVLVKDAHSLWCSRKNGALNPGNGEFRRFVQAFFFFFFLYQSGVLCKYAPQLLYGLLLAIKPSFVFRA